MHESVLAWLRSRPRREHRVEFIADGVAMALLFTINTRRYTLPLTQPRYSALTAAIARLEILLRRPRLVRVYPLYSGEGNPWAVAAQGTAFLHTLADLLTKEQPHAHVILANVSPNDPRATDALAAPLQSGGGPAR
jgi:hypothetical protein